MNRVQRVQIFLISNIHESNSSIYAYINRVEKTALSAPQERNLNLVKPCIKMERSEFMNYTPEHSNAVFQVNGVIEDINRLEECDFSTAAAIGVLLIAEIRELNKQLNESLKK